MWREGEKLWCEKRQKLKYTYLISYILNSLSERKERFQLKKSLSLSLLKMKIKTIDFSLYKLSLSQPQKRLEKKQSFLISYVEIMKYFDSLYVKKSRGSAL
jgi:hypothetical protein